MLKLAKTLPFLILLFSSAAFSDIRDRINDCENRGGSNGCVYDLLRELSDNSQSYIPDRIVTGCACQNNYKNSLWGKCELIYTRNNITKNEIEERTLISWDSSCNSNSNGQACLERLENTTLCRIYPSSR